MAVAIPIEKEDESNSEPFSEELNPIAFALRRAFQLSPEQEPKVFNLTVLLGVTQFKMSPKVANWVQEWDFEQSHKEFHFRGGIYQFNSFDKEPTRRLMIDFATKTICFEGE